MIKIDLHMHSGEDPHDGLAYPATALIDRAAELGYGAIAITLHKKVLEDERCFEYARQKGVLLIRAVEWNIQTVDVLRAELLRRWRAAANERIAELLTRHHWRIGTAESCTGGLIGDELTNRAGSSTYFLGGIISYDNRIKQQALGVQAETLTHHGAVSDQCALEMARGVRATLGLDVGVSATGIAGPGGGSPDKPVGLVYVGVSTPTRERVQRFVWDADRVGNKRHTADAAFRLLIACLEEN